MGWGEGGETGGRGVEGGVGAEGWWWRVLDKIPVVSDKDDLTQYIISLVSPVLRD